MPLTTWLQFLEPSLVFKIINFGRLKSLSKIIDHRIKYLLKVKKAIEMNVKKFGDYGKDRLNNKENSQHTYFTTYNVECVIRHFLSHLYIK